MRPAILTVVSPSRWESDLALAARASGIARILARCASPAEVDRRLEEADVVVVGAETGWLTTALVRRWRSEGVVVAGVADATDRAASRLLRAVGCDPVYAHAEPPMRLLAGLVLAAAARSGRREPPPAPLVAVTGPRGAPGRTEVALALAWGASGSLLVELDHAAPSIGLRLGLPPGSTPSEADPGAGRAVSAAGCGPIRVVSGPVRPGPLGDVLAIRLAEAARREFPLTVVDVGPDPGWFEERVRTDATVVVCDVGPVGLVRAARFLATWPDEPPLLVANRVPPGPGEEAALRGVRAATGLDPVAVVHRLEGPPGHTGPDPAMVAALGPVLAAVSGSAPAPGPAGTAPVLAGQRAAR